MRIRQAPTYGKVTIGRETIEAPRGECPGKLSTFATISYEWTAHNNKTISDTFNATWSTSDGWNVPFTFNIKVPVVRPDHETTAFNDWDPNPLHLTDGRWKQTLHPPADDPSFDFSGESVQEADAAGTHSDTCYFVGSIFPILDKITGGTLTVASGNVWSFDNVGYFHAAVTYYRLPHVVNNVTIPARAPCGARFPQQMTIKAPPDTSYNNYAGINGLGGDIGKTTVTSIRAGSTKTKTWP